ncbi:MAG: ADP-glyceromanno-heptose 6-epimerase [Taibaiella sp.]|nr:ADP-glyceromanno-heptose 6-epimerase [Taibaiella sp.]
MTRRFIGNSFFDWLAQHPGTVDTIVHLGARTDTTLTDKQVFKILNVDYTKRLFEWCTEHDIPFIYASSAATYGNGAHGYRDDESLLPQLEPLNQYARSKQEIDLWITDQKKKPPFWAGFKFFNVYGPNESHKGRMASVVYHAYNEILKNGYVTLFKSHHKDYKDGEQLRDFVYVKDVVRVLIYFLEHQPKSGIFNLGTGKADTFLSLVQALFEAIGHQGKVKFIDTPENIRENYQYFTEANMEKLRLAGYTGVFADIREGVADYAVNYLETAEQF